ncbi:MAG TPA: hypothetical protein VJ761_21750 [Ktedonobacteraceae bacterium]|nr:hypothetical protein [Ktedonobacteraceae bacterium]
MIFQLGTITLYIDNPYFSVGFQRGRELYARDCQLVPARQGRLSISEVLRYVAVPTGKTGHWHFDAQTADHVEEYLGVFLGYLYGALPASDPSRR